MDTFAKPYSKSFGRFVPTVKTPYSFDVQLEGLRGFAALGVMLWHGIGMGIIDQTNSIPAFVSYISLGPLAVYIFFMLSGYVMALRYQKVEGFRTGEYLKARFVRLYPGYLVTFLLLLLLQMPPVLQFITNLLMLQNNTFHAPAFRVLEPIVPIWSIHFEVVFYLLFPLVIYFKPNIKLCIGALLILGIIIFYRFYSIISVSCYCFGFIFWLSGVIIAWKLNSIEKSTFRFLSYIFLALCYAHLFPGDIILKGLHIDSKYSGTLDNMSVGFKTMFYLPFCFLLLNDLSKREHLGKGIMVMLSYIMPGIILVFLAFKHRLFTDIRWEVCLITFVLSVLTYNEKKVSTLILNKLQGVGKISYGVYLFHMPLGMIIGHYLLINTTWGILVKYLLWFILTFGLAYFTDSILQKRIKRFFFQK